MMKNRVLVTTSTFPIWEGDFIPPFVYELSKRLGENLEIFVLAPYSEGSKRYEIRDNMKIFRFKYWFNRKYNLADGAILPNLKKNFSFWFQVPFFLMFQFLAVRKICKKYEINRIHAHWIIPQGLIAVLYKKLFRKDVKILITTHGADIFGLQRFSFLKKWILNYATRLTVVSEAIRKEALKIGSGTDIDVLPMGVDLSLFNPDKKSMQLRRKYVEDGGQLLLFLGRLSEKKGVKYLKQSY
jgi:glycosyltransferase involved in cell wall biosynthesis